MKKAFLIFFAFLLAILPLSAYCESQSEDRKITYGPSSGFKPTGSYETLSTGDLMIVENTNSAPLYASFYSSNNTVITYVPKGSVCLYIAAVDFGYCVAYENFVGYMDEYYLKKVSSTRFNFALPNGNAFLSVIEKPSNTFTPTPTQNPRIKTFPYSPLIIYPNQNISTRSGPGTQYTEPGTFSANYAYTVYYQTTGGSVNWGYVEFPLNGKKIRAYTGVKRFSTSGYLPYDNEAFNYVTVISPYATHYGPGNEYVEAPYEHPSYGTQAKAFFTENGWTMIEYYLSDGRLHRGWIPNWCLN